MTDWHPLAQLAVIALAAGRVTRLLVADAVLDIPRGLVLARLTDHRWATTLATCPWCLGWWVAAAWSGAWALWPTVATAVAVPWAVAVLAWWSGAWWLSEADGDE